MPSWLAMALSVEPVISSEISIWRRGSVSEKPEVMIGTDASQTASNSHCSASTSCGWRTTEARNSCPGA